MVQLRRFLANKEEFNKIIESYPSLIKHVEPKDIYNYFCGTYYKGMSTKNIYTDDTQYIIMPEYLLNGLFDNIYGCTEYKQIVIRLDVTIKEITRDYTGSWCYNQLMKLLKKVYTPQEIEDILHSYDNVKYNKGKIQYHYNFEQFTYLDTEGCILDLKNCTKYDINGAHEDAFIQMFPKAKDLLLAEEAKKAKAKLKGDIETVRRIKSIFNYCVGFLKRKGYIGAYNWIVQRTTNKLHNAIKLTNGELLYANTDGFIVQNEKTHLKTSSELGEFKLEHQGDVYFYIDKNYFMFEYTSKGKKEQTGSNLQEVRPYINLTEGIVAHYNRVRIPIGTKPDGSTLYTQEAQNIVTEKVKIKEIK